MNKKKKIPAWLATEYSEGNLRGIRDELRKIQTWADGYNAAKGDGVVPAIPGSGLLGGPRRAIVLINKLLEACP